MTRLGSTADEYALWKLASVGVHVAQKASLHKQARPSLLALPHKHTAHLC